MEDCKARIVLGRNAFGHDVCVQTEKRFAHALSIGLTGSGKTVYFDQLIQQDIELVPRTGNQPRVITGHIDFLQIRNGAVHILDYKPDAHTNKPIAQLTIYALALTRLVPGLKLFDIKCAWFNEQEYCEFFPRTVVRHAPFNPSGTP